MPTTTLYGSPLSLYTGRARSYLIKAGIDYREHTPTTDHFKSTVLPAMGGRQSVPVVETEAGEVIRDGAAIVDHYEALNGEKFSPTTPLLGVLSRLFDVIGAEGLLRPAMHYRWNFPETNLDFLRFHFQTFVPPGLDKVEYAEKSMNRMRQAGRNFGVMPETFEVVESAYLAVLEKLNAHFSASPYLLGTTPCIGDFGMIAPLYGHLGRDPQPLSIMQSRAVQLFRWVERMNRPEADTGEFALDYEGYYSDDSVPDSLVALLEQLAVDFIPETAAAAETINRWIDDQAVLEAGTVVERGVGMASFELAGMPIQALAQPYRFYLLSRVQDAFEALTENEQAYVRNALQRCGMEAVLSLTISRRIGREGNREVWL